MDGYTQDEIDRMFTYDLMRDSLAGKDNDELISLRNKWVGVTTLFGEVALAAIEEELEDREVEFREVQ